MDEVSGTRVGAKCGRWSPTAEQVKVLTDLFTSGLRTPTTEQIQMISSHLSSFGKIESKNVFYWFQNHKARERHHKKRRRGSSGGAGDVCTGLRSTVPDKKEARHCNARVAADQQAELIWERRGRDIETLELFPLSSFKLQEGEAWMTTAVRNEWREVSLFDPENDPPLDLRLSFL